MGVAKVAGKKTVQKATRGVLTVEDVEDLRDYLKRARTPPYNVLVRLLDSHEVLRTALRKMDGPCLCCSRGCVTTSKVCRCGTSVLSL